MLDHWHLYVAPVAYAPGQDKLFSYDQPRLFRDVQRVRDRVNGRVAEVLREELGVRVELKGNSLHCPDVPLACVNATSTRKFQIEEYLRALGVEPTPYARKIAAHATRHWNAGVTPATADATRELCERHGFNPAKVYSQQPSRQAKDTELYRIVSESADTLAKSQGLFTRLEHEALCYRAAVAQNVRPQDVDRMIDRVYADWPVFGIHKLSGGRYTTSLSKFAWDRFTAAAERLPRVDVAAAFRPLREGAALAAALGRDAAKGLVGLIRKARSGGHFDVVRVRDLTRYVEDLTPGPRWKSHLKAGLGALKPGLGGLNARLRHAEHVYRTVRHPKQQLTRRALVVVENASRQRPDDLARLVKLARKYGATVQLVDGRRPPPYFRPTAARLWPDQFAARRVAPKPPRGYDDQQGQERRR